MLIRTILIRSAGSVALATLLTPTLVAAQQGQTGTTNSGSGQTAQTSQGTSNTGASLRDSAGVQGLAELSSMAATESTNDVFSGSRADPRAGATTGGGSTTGLGSGLAGGLGGSLFGGSNRQGSSTTRRDTSRRAQYNMRLDLGSGPQSGSAAPVVARAASIRGLNQSFTRLNGVTAQARIEGSTLVLEGTATSTQSRELASRLALLEPGVRSVQNNLVVTTAEPKK